MNKLTITAVLILTLATLQGAAFGEQENFKISVTIPAIPGVNVGVANEEEQNQPPAISPLEAIKDKIIELTGTTVVVTLVEK